MEDTTKKIAFENLSEVQYYGIIEHQRKMKLGLEYLLRKQHEDEMIKYFLDNGGEG